MGMEFNKSDFVVGLAPLIPNLARACEASISTSAAASFLSIARVGAIY